MPIYEFYCPDCHTIFNFFSRTVNTSTQPACPRCRKLSLDRLVSAFATIGRAGEEGDDDSLPFDEQKMEGAMEALAGEVENVDSDDPRQAARLMRKFSDATGIEFGESMQEALGRMEAGEDPEAIEAEMGDLMEQEDPFVMPNEKGKGGVRRRRGEAPLRDETLYDL